MWKIQWASTLSVVLLAGSPARASDDVAPGKNEATAENQFDLGVRHFDDSQFEAAARAFLRADVLRPDSDTLSNALIAAQKSGAHLLVVEVTERALTRHDIDPGLVVQARRAQADSAGHLALLRLSCSPQPCTLFVDDQKETRLSFYLLPGTHHAYALFAGPPETRSPQEQFTLKAGTTYEYQFRPTAPTSDAPPAHGHASTSGSSPSDNETPWRRSIGPYVFAGAATTTLVLAGLTTWSGLEATQAVNEIEEGGATDTEKSDAQAMITRTDIFLSAAIVSGVFTLGWGIWGTDFTGTKSGTTVSIIPRGLGLDAQGTF